MEFDNTPKPAASKWAILRGHLPIAILVGAALALFIGMHSAATTVAAVAGVHIVGALAIMGFRWFRNSRKPVSS